MSPHRSTVVRGGTVLVLAFALLLGACGSSEGSSGSGGSRDAVTLKVAGMGIKSQLPGSEFGAAARVKEFNDNHEIDGVTLDYVEYVDDKQDQATALSEARRLVADEGVMAMVGMTSQVVPADYLEQQEVPWFGWGFDNSYCSPQASTDVWGFGFDGCLVPSDPSTMPDSGRLPYQYVKGITGNARPTIAIFSNDTESGRAAAANQKFSYGGNGFDVVFNEGLLAPPPVSDFTPYVQKLMTSNDGGQPDAVLCLLAIECISMYTNLKSSGFTGTYLSPVYSDALATSMAGSSVSSLFANLNEPNDYLDHMKKAVAAVNPDYPVDSGVVAGYTSTDMFIQALKTVADSGKGEITGADIQKAASIQIWEAPGFAGPTKYPQSTVGSFLSCNSVLYSDGTKWVTKEPYSCSDKTWPTS